MPDIELSLQAELAALRQQVAALTKERDAAVQMQRGTKGAWDAMRDERNAEYARADAAEGQVRELRQWLEHNIAQVTGVVSDTQEELHKARSKDADPYYAEHLRDTIATDKVRIKVLESALARLGAEARQDAEKENMMDATNYLTFADYNVACDYVQKLAPPITIRCVGMQGGSGMKVCSSQAEALEALKEAMADRIFGKTCDRVRIYGDLQPPTEPAPVQGPIVERDPSFPPDDTPCRVVKRRELVQAKYSIVQDFLTIAESTSQYYAERIARALNLLAEKEARDVPRD